MHSKMSKVFAIKEINDGLNMISNLKEKSFLF